MSEAQGVEYIRGFYAAIREHSPKIVALQNSRNEWQHRAELAENELLERDAEIRQQAERIAELEREVTRVTELHKGLMAHADARVDEADERIADLTLKLSNAELLCGHHKTVIVERDGRIAALEAALRRIEKWFGEFPPTGETWPDSDRPMSYGAAYGSNGERDYMRSIAATALLGDSK